MDAVDQAILNALLVNLGYREGEQVALVSQSWSDEFESHRRTAFDLSYRLCSRMVDVFRKALIPVDWVTYRPKELRNGADATPELYGKIGSPDIVFMPTVFSLTHTAFRRALTGKGVRIASMPTFTLDMFAEGGPMRVDYCELDRKTREVADRLSHSRYVRVRGPDTDMVIEVDGENVHVSSGLLTKPGAWGNLPGAEAYAPPVHEGASHGFFTVPSGWGGSTPIPFPIMFHVKQGRFIRAQGGSAEAQTYIEQTIHPILFGAENYDVLAEIGIGTNTSLNADYITRKGWSTLVAEKIGGSAHFANGNSKAMGGVNDVPIHIDWVVDQVQMDYNFSPI